MADPITEAVEGLLPPSDLANKLRKPKPDPIVCSWCRGTGKRQARRRFSPESWSRPALVDCGACNGTGTF